MDLFKNRPIDLDFIWLEQFSTYSSMYFNIVCSSASIFKPNCCPDQHQPQICGKISVRDTNFPLQRVSNQANKMTEQKVQISFMDIPLLWIKAWRWFCNKQITVTAMQMAFSTNKVANGRAKNMAIPALLFIQQ